MDLRPGVISGEASARRANTDAIRKAKTPPGGAGLSIGRLLEVFGGELQPPSLERTYRVSVSGEFRQTRFLFRHLGQSGGQRFFDCGNGPTLTRRACFVLIAYGLSQVRFCDDAMAPFGRLDRSYVLGLLPR